MPPRHGKIIRPGMDAMSGNVRQSWVNKNNGEGLESVVTIGQVRSHLP